MDYRPARFFSRAILLAVFFVFSAPLGALVAQDEPPSLVVIAGTVQSVLGCDGDWMPECEATALAYDADDDLWQATFDLPAGEYEYKAALNGSWDENYGLNAEMGGANIPLSLAEDTSVKFIYSDATHWVTSSANSLIANVPGSYQSELGCPDDWMPDCLRSLLQDPDGDGIYQFSTSVLPAGAYESKVAVNESWTLNYGADGVAGGANIAFVVAEDNTEVVFSFDSATNIMTVVVGGAVAPAVGNLFASSAYWVTADTLAWNTDRIPGANYQLHTSAEGGLALTDAGVEGGQTYNLEYTRGDLPEAVLAQHPELADYFMLRLSAEDAALAPELLRGQVAISTSYGSNNLLTDATGVQIAYALDDLYADAAADTPLGVTFEGNIPTLRVWAPTATQVQLHRFSDAADTEAVIAPMDYDADSGIWSITGDGDWYGQYYLYEVSVYAPSALGQVVNLVTDPYSLSLSTNGERSQIVDLSDPALFPEGWADDAPPALAAFEDISLYELHIRDFSINDATVPEQDRGTYMAFTHADSDGMMHLRALADAGLTHLHLLPTFDIATINENAAERQEADRAALEALPPDSEEQQALINPTRDLDGFNWGYDPYHYTTPEGSYSTDPEGAARIREFRAMVMGLHESGLRVVMDVVYNHTSDAGQNPRSVLDRIVPGYYHRLSADGRIETSTCCQNTATENRMMARLMNDSVLTWATAYDIDGFRFDLMGHHMRDNMLDLRQSLDALTPAEDGTDGAAIYLYGEGWDFGEVAANARGINATQLNMAGTGIGTFSDRLRDAVRGGNPFGGLQEQGFSNGLYTDPNEVDTRTPEEQLAQLMHDDELIRLGLAGNLADYPLVNAAGEIVTGADIDYNGNQAGYTQDPQENIVYVSAHDNETIFDAIMIKAALAATMDERVRMQNQALSFVTFAQGVPFFHAGDDILRSKSLDRNSYNSGDWYNAIDWSLATSNWGHGLPLASDNQTNWPLIQPLLANPELASTPEQRAFANSVFRENLSIRRDSALFRLQTEQDVIDRVTFTHTGEETVPGVIVMHLSDVVGDNLDPNYARIVVIFNASPDAQTLSEPELAGMSFTLHPTQAGSVDAIVQGASFDSAAGAFTVPGRTTAVFVLPE